MVVFSVLSEVGWVSAKKCQQTHQILEGFFSDSLYYESVIVGVSVTCSPPSGTIGCTTVSGPSTRKDMQKMQMEEPEADEDKVSVHDPVEYILLKLFFLHVLL